MTLTPEQHAERLTGIGASDAAAAMGLSKWKTPLELYLEKTGEAEEIETTELMYWGSKLETMIAEGWSEKTGIKVRRVNESIRHPEHDFMLAHLDRRQVGNGRILECKNVNVYYARASFGEDGSDEVPDQYLIQVHHQLIIARAKWDAPGADLAALIGGNELRTFRFDPDDELEELIIKRESAFWKCVIDRTPPPPQTLGDLDILYAEDNGQIKAVTDPEIVKRCDHIRALKSAAKSFETTIKEEELALKLTIAEAAGISAGKDLKRLEHKLEGIERPGIAYAGQTLATWKTQSRTTIDAKKLKALEPEIFEKFSRTNSFRVLRITNP